jgi:hypothetical protein
MPDVSSDNGDYPGNKRTQEPRNDPGDQRNHG